MQRDQIDLCYYDPSFEGGLSPDQILELKYTEPDDPGQIRRYREATDKMAEHHLDADPDDIDVGMFAPSYGDRFGGLSRSVRDRIDFRQFEESPVVPSFASRLDSY